MPTPETLYLHTGDDNLDEILAMDAPEPDKRGIQCRPGTPGSAPIVLILGAPGTGKTTLALQIASRVASGPHGNCRAFFYSLEQPFVSLAESHSGFAFPATLVDYASTDEAGAPTGAIRVCHFAPLPISDAESNSAFEDRFKQLAHMLTTVKRDLLNSDAIPVFFLDSLNALATSSMHRNDIYRLCTLFRAHGIPVFITAERHASGTPEAGLISEPARFLADIVVELTRDDAASHILQYLEVSKSRNRRQALGRHLYKIRTAQAPSPERAGFVVYRSMPCVLSTVREHHAGDRNQEYELCPESECSEPDAGPLYSLLRQHQVAAGDCFALMGPPGTHKLALAMNIATGRVLKPQNRRSLLLISFGGYGPIKFSGVAWFESRAEWSKLVPTEEAPSRPKWWAIDFREGGQPQNGDDPRATQLIFRLGHLTPEESFDCIDRLTREREYSAVVLSDTAEICTGFPLLRRDPLFLPALIDLFHERGLVSVCIGVQADAALNRDMDFALQSCADYRMSLAHYPNSYELARSIASHKRRDSAATQQWVNVVVDNVSGKHYSRKPQWLAVWEPGESNAVTPSKQLFCGTWEQLQEWRAQKDRPHDA